jgi:uncharacterized protein (DUF4213/DUF364 family)
VSVADAVALLRDRDALSTTVDRVTVGDRVVLVELTDEERGPIDATRAGVAHRPAGDPPATDDLSLERLVRAVESPTEAESSERLDRALGVAAVNALSVPFLDWQAGDPMALLDADVDRITTVGLFRPAFRKFDDVTVRVIERDPIEDVPSRDGVAVETFTPEETAAAMAGADVVFVTGSTFIYGGIDAYLDAAPADATVVVIGATASFLPAPLFDRGVDVVAGASVSSPDAVRDAVARGACGTDLHDAGLRKVYTAASQPAGLRLDSRDDYNPPNQ